VRKRALQSLKVISRQLLLKLICAERVWKHRL